MARPETRGDERRVVLDRPAGKSDHARNPRAGAVAVDGLDRHVKHVGGLPVGEAEAFLPGAEVARPEAP